MRALGAGSMFVGLVLSLFLALGQFGLIAASAGGWNDRSGDGGTGSTASSGGSAGGSSGGGAIRDAAPVTAAKGQGKVDVKWYGQDPTTYDHTTGIGGDSDDATETELQAEDFRCLDKVVFYAEVDADGLAGQNTTTINVSFGKQTTSNQPFGFNAGHSVSLDTSGLNYSGDAGETFTHSWGSTPTAITLSVTITDVEGNEDIWVRVVVILGNCGPGSATGNVLTKIEGASTVDSTGDTVTTQSGAQTVPLKFQGTLPTIRLIKDIAGSAPDAGKFDLKVDGVVVADDVGDGGQSPVQTILAGDHQIDEDAGTGTDLDNYSTVVSCVADTGASANFTGPGPHTLSVALPVEDTAEDWVCTFTNTPRPTTETITAHKFSDLDGDGQQGESEPDLPGWEISVFTDDACSGDPVASGETDENGDVTFTLPFGTYYVSETQQGGWTQTAPEGNCAPVSISRTSGAQTVTFGNQQHGSITIVKDAVPNDPQDFSFGGDLGEFTLDDDADQTLANTQTFSDLEPGSYTISEGSVPGWDLTDLTCVSDGQASSWVREGGSVTIDLAPGESVGCTFQNTRKPGTITAHKFSDLDGDGQQGENEPDLSGWEIRVFTDDACKGEPVASGETDENGDVTFGDLAPGTYYLSETQQGGWEQTTPSPNCVQVILPAGGQGAVTFGNQQHGSITVVKALSPSEDPGQFELQIDDQTHATGGDGTSTGAIDVSPGTHTVSEAATEGTNPGDYTSSISCVLDLGEGTEPLASGQGTSLEVEVGAGQHVICTITNTRNVTPPPPPPPPPFAGIQIVKGGPALAHVGDTITYTFDVSLATGSASLTNVTVTDPICDAGTLSAPTGDDGDTVLEQGETWHYTCSHVVTSTDPDPLPNTATATGSSGGRTVSDQDSHEVDLIHPAIEIVKRARPRSGSPGEEITYTYTVTNTGDVTLVDISVDDDKLGHVCDIASLDPDESDTCTMAFEIPTGDNPPQIENVGTAVGEDPLGETVEDQDDETIDVVLGQTVTPTKTPPGGVAFTGSDDLIRFGALALGLLILGTGLLWAGARRRSEI